MTDKNIPLRSGTWSIEEVAKINELIPQCITLKPIVYLVNLDSKSFKRKANKWLVRSPLDIFKCTYEEFFFVLLFRCPSMNG